MSDFKGRIRERDLLVPALKAAATRVDGEITTTELIGELSAEFQPEGEDAEILAGRQDSRFSQIVRNIKAHKDSRTSIFSRGYATGTEDGFRITQAGRDFLDRLPE